IAKYDSSGNVLWAKSAGRPAYDEGLGITGGLFGKGIITGYFGGLLITFDTTVLYCLGLSNIFFVKYDPSGNVLWAKKAGGTGGDLGAAVSADVSGNIFVTGYIQSPSVTFGTITLTDSGGHDFFIAKYDSSGNVLWAKSAGGTQNDAGV